MLDPYLNHYLIKQRISELSKENKYYQSDPPPSWPWIILLILLLVFIFGHDLFGGTI